uniref:Ubiquitin associated protein 2 n=1 Tax=Ursus americanus TaxID=9643 RepID=A0A452RYM8_URSAM
MMTSVSSDRSRGAREKTQISATQASQLQKQVVQATAEQMRLAQVIFDKNDSEFEAKVKQLMEVTGKNQDECIVALHDCNGDVNKAINILLEGNSDTTSWETVGGKKKNFGKESSENKENREKRSERELNHPCVLAFLFCQHASAESTPSLPSSATFSTAATSASGATSSGLSLPSSMNTVNSLCLGGTTVSAPSSSTRATPLVTSGKAPPNLPQGVPPLLHNQYLVGPGGLLPAYPIYGYDELQMLQSRLPMDYYGIPFATPTALASRDGSLANNPYSGDVTKFGRGDSASPAPPTTLAQPQQSQSQAHHTAQQPFLNPALPPGYSYTGLPYYTGVPSAFQYGPTMFVPPASAKQHGVNLSTPTAPFQQASGYGQHSYSAGYDDLTQGTAAGDYTKGGYGGSSQAQNKSAGSGPGKGVSVSSSTTGLPDMTGSVYNKTQTFDKQGFHAGTPPPFSLPSALGSTGPLAAGAAPGYAPPPFLHILPAHQQPHSQLLHHHLPQDAQSGSGQRSQPSSLQPKSQASKPAYGNSPYWTN